MEISNRDNLSTSNDFNCSIARKIGEHLSKIGYSLKDISKDEFEQIIVTLRKELVLSPLNGESLTQEIIHSLVDELYKGSKDFEKRWCVYDGANEVELSSEYYDEDTTYLQILEEYVRITDKQNEKTEIMLEVIPFNDNNKNVKIKIDIFSNIIDENVAMGDRINIISQKKEDPIANALKKDSVYEKGVLKIKTGFEDSVRSTEELLNSAADQFELERQPLLLNKRLELSEMDLTLKRKFKLIQELKENDNIPLATLYKYDCLISSFWVLEESVDRHVNSNVDSQEGNKYSEMYASDIQIISNLIDEINTDIDNVRDQLMDLSDTVREFWKKDYFQSTYLDRFVDVLKCYLVECTSEDLSLDEIKKISKDIDITKDPYIKIINSMSNLFTINMINKYDVELWDDDPDILSVPG